MGVILVVEIGLVMRFRLVVGVSLVVGVILVVGVLRVVGVRAVVEGSFVVGVGLVGGVGCGRRDCRHTDEWNTVAMSAHAFFSALDMRVVYPRLNLAQTK